MGWKGTLRSLIAAQRRIERESKRRQRELELEQKRIAKMQELKQAAHEVEAYENYIQVLTSIHKNCGEEWDWGKIYSSQPPEKPVRKKIFEKEAQKKLESYRPNIIDKVLRRDKSRKQKINKLMELAKRKDENIYLEALEEYKKNYANWETTHLLAMKILSGDIEAYINVIAEINPFKEINELGFAVEFQPINDKILEVTLYTNGENIVPTEVKTLLRSGKLSVKKMSKTKFYELYQDYICSATLRVACEMFALLPIETIIITVVSEILNTKTGHLENRPILSVAIPRKTLKKLNFAALDPSDAMDNFIHKMNFRKTKGFAPVERILPSDIKL